MTEDEAKAAVIAAAETLVNKGSAMYPPNLEYYLGTWEELCDCVAQYRQFQRRAFLVAHGEAANISLVYYGGRVTLEQPNGEFTVSEENAMRSFTTWITNEQRSLQTRMANGVMERACFFLLQGFQRLERIGPWPFENDLR